jgi:hypothetical protein
MRHLSVAGLALVVLGGCAVSADGGAPEGETLGVSEDGLEVASLNPIPYPRPNLVAVAPDGKVQTSWYGFRYCDYDADGFVVRVKNVGLGPSGPSMTAIRGEDPAKWAVLATPGLAPGETVELRLDLWSFTVWDPDASFWITVDAAGEVKEMDEANTFTGWCLG